MCVLHSDHNDAGRFSFRSTYGKELSPYPRPTIKHGWKIIGAFLSPLGSHTHTMKYKVGRSKTRSIGTTWNIRAERVFEYYSYAKVAGSSTWSEEREETSQIHVEKGDSVVVWQYVLSASQCDEEWSFRSNLIADTPSTARIPALP
jgi:hypothetical protein